MPNLETAARGGRRAPDRRRQDHGLRGVVAADGLVTVREVVRDIFGDHDPPSTLLGVAVLGYTDQLVEVEAVAAVRMEA